MTSSSWWIICLAHLAMVRCWIGLCDVVGYTTTFECYVIRVILGWRDYLFTSCIAPCIIASFTDPIMLLKVAWINVIKGQWLLTNSTSVWHDYSMLPTITAAIPEPMIIATIGYIMLYSWRCAVTRPVMNSIVRAMLMSVRFDTYIQVIIRCGYI